MYQSLSPPRWAPGAIATERGWTDPRTGEILVARKDLLSKQPILIPIPINETEIHEPKKKPGRKPGKKEPETVS